VRQPWGKDTVVKFLGGELHFRMEGDRGKDDWVKDLQGFKQRGNNLQPAFLAIARYLMGSVRRTFEAEGRPSPWAPLSPKYAAWKARVWGTPILVRKGDLRDSLTEEGNPYMLLRITPRALQYGSTLPYFRAHQHGLPERNLPARPMLVLQRQDRAQISRIINKFVLTGQVTYQGPVTV
jgi:phage gpG-like protein